VVAISWRQGLSLPLDQKTDSDKLWVWRNFFEIKPIIKLEFLFPIFILIKTVHWTLGIYCMLSVRLLKDGPFWKYLVFSQSACCNSNLFLVPLCRCEMYTRICLTMKKQTFELAEHILGLRKSLEKQSWSA
jgi:hypothetical protein